MALLATSRVDTTTDFLCHLSHCKLISSSKPMISVQTVVDTFITLQNFYGKIKPDNIINNIVGRLPVIAIKNKSELTFCKRAFDLISNNHQNYLSSNSYKSVDGNIESVSNLFATIDYFMSLIKINYFIKKIIQAETTPNTFGHDEAKLIPSVSYAAAVCRRLSIPSVSNSTRSSTNSLRYREDDDTYDFLGYLNHTGQISVERPTMNTSQLIGELMRLKESFNQFPKLSHSFILNNILGRQNIIAVREGNDITFNSNAFKLISDKGTDFKSSNIYKALTNDELLNTKLTVAATKESTSSVQVCFCLFVFFFIFSFGVFFFIQINYIL